MKPVIALVGRPNVGKSTFFNQLTRSRDALVADYSGLTRDRQYGEGSIEGKEFVVIDTAGITGDEEGIDAAMADQSLAAVEEADIVIFILDSRAGLLGPDYDLAKHLRTRNKPIYVVANKIDGVDPDVAMADIYALGLGEVFPTTATHGKGVRSLMDAVLEPFDPVSEDDEDDDAGVKIAIVGRPNVGKSTLVNRMLGEERVVVYDYAGTTRDSVYIPFEREDKQYTLIDTAGIRRRKSVKLTVEKFSIVKTLKAISDANVVIIMMDAQEGLVEQDLHLMGHVIDSGRALVVAINKWDGLESEKKEYIKTELNRRLRFVDFADIHFISALHGTGVGHLYESVDAAYESSVQKLNTTMLTRILEDAQADHQPPMINGRRIKLKYAHAGGKNPPIIVVHGNQTAKVPEHYRKYLEKTFRRALKLSGTPIRIEFRGNDNPYEGRKNKLTERQVKKKQRLVKHHKKSK